MTQTILYGVSSKMRTDFLNGLIAENVLMKQYERNKREAESFSLFGFNVQDLINTNRTTRNPLLKARIQEMIQSINERRTKSNEQNKLSLEKLQNFEKTALGMGLRKVMRNMRKICASTLSDEAQLVLMLLEIEFANLSAKKPMYGKMKRATIYERKSILLHRVQPLLERCGWRYGYNDANGKNANYIIYVYLPNGVQVSWHTNDYYIYKYYPQIDAEWDSQVCSTMEKLLSFIGSAYLQVAENK